MEMETIYENAENCDIKYTRGHGTQNDCQNEARKHRSRRCLLLMTVILGLVCVLLLVFITLRETQLLNLSYKNRFEEFNETIDRLQSNYSELMIKMDELQNSFNSLSQKQLELDTRVSDLTGEKSQLQQSVKSLSQKTQELETALRKLLEKGKEGRLFMSPEAMSWSDSRQFCRGRGAHLVIIKSEEKQKFISSFVQEFVWIGLSDIEDEGSMTWVDNSPLNQGFWEINEPNDSLSNEDCVELNPGKPDLNNWNDIPCSDMRKCLCEI